MPATWSMSIVASGNRVWVVWLMIFRF